MSDDGRHQRADHADRRAPAHRDEGQPADDRRSVFAGADRALVLALFAERLRRAGVGVGVAAIERAVAALDTVGSAPTVDDLYWCTRLSFVSDQPEIEIFDAVFTAVFANGNLAATERARRNQAPSPSPGSAHARVRGGDDPEEAAGRGLPWATRPSIASEDEQDDGDDPPVDLPERLASAAFAEPDRPFDQFDDVELARVEHLVAAWVDRRPRRPSRRRRSAPAGRIELRAALRRAGRTGGEAVVLPRSRPGRRTRPVAVLLDVSGSMESYTRVFLHVGRALVAAGGAEVFALATETSRLTPALRHHAVDEVAAELSEAVADRFGGTRLASSLRNLLAHPSWSDAVRGAVVVVVSDGWDTDPPDQLDRRMARLDRLAHRVLWVNPRAAAEGFEPLVAGMAAALPHCDRLLSGHSPTALIELLDAIAAGERERARR